MRSPLDSLRAVQNWVGAHSIPLVVADATPSWHRTVYLPGRGRSVDLWSTCSFFKTLGANTQEYVGAPRSTFRKSRPSKKFPNYKALMSSIIDSKPSNFQKVADQQVWRDAIVEYTSIMKNDVCDIVPRPKGKSIVTSRWLYKIKHVANGSIEKFKARFVARGFSQKEGGDYEETFAPIVRYASIRAVMSTVSVMGWIIDQMDVKTTFLNMIIEEEVYIEQPELNGKESHVCRLKKSVYGLKQAPRVWYSRINGYLLSMGYTKSEANPNLYYILLGLICLF
jgi:hypothetical protein